MNKIVFLSPGLIEIPMVISVLRSRTLALVSGQDGRALDPAIVARLEELAAVANELGLAAESTRLAKLVSVARRGYVHNLEHAALKCLSDL